MDCFNPSTASGGFTLFAVLVAFCLGAAGYRWLLSSKYAAKMKELEDKAAQLEDKIRAAR